MAIAAKSVLLLSSLAVILAACEPVTTAPRFPAAPPAGPWQAVILLPGGQIETSFELSRNDAGYQASLVNGQERVPVDEVRFENGELLLRFSVFNNEIRATWQDGVLAGSLTLVKRYGLQEHMPFNARPGSEHVHEGKKDPASIDMSGRWAVQFRSEDGTTAPSIGEFAQRGSRLFGTFVNVDGDHRYLAGHVERNVLELSTFDGARALLFRGTVVDGSISNADFWSGMHSHQTWSAVRKGDASLPDAYSTTRLKPEHEGLTFSFPDHAGNIVSLDDEKFSNKVVVVALAGTWCPNCNDEAHFLSKLHSEFKSNDLAIVFLMFEHFEDATIAADLIKKFRAKHTIKFDTLIAGVSDKVMAAQRLPDLDAVVAFPTTIFIDRERKVRTIHTGFSGPGTGEYHDELKSEFRELIAGLVAETPVPVITEDAEAAPTE